MGLKRRFGPGYAAAMAERERKEQEQEAHRLVEAMSDFEAKSVLMMLTQDLPGEVLEVIEELGGRKR